MWRKIGLISFPSGKVIISDPSADAPVPGESFSTNLAVKIDPGPWMASYLFDSKEQRVKRLSIQHSKKPAAKGTPRIIGDVGVDAGMAGIFDAPHFPKGPRYLDPDDKWYKDISKRLWGKSNMATATLVPSGVVSSSGWGDGIYDVIAWGQPGHIYRIDLVYIDEPSCVELLKSVIT